MGFVTTADLDVRVVIASNDDLVRIAGRQRTTSYIDSGAEIPSRPSARASVMRVASTSARRAAEV